MISVYLVVMNEEHNIRRVLESVKEFEDIVVVDSGSTDRTMEIASLYTDRLYHRQWTGMAEQKEYAKNLCKYDWVLNLDADEEIGLLFHPALLQLINDGNASGANIPINDHFMGVAMHEYTRRNSHIRFFKKSCGSYGSERFHESPTVKGKIVNFQQGINHYGDSSLEIKVYKSNRYSSGKALDKFDKRKTSSVAKLILVMPIMFAKSYIIRRNFLSGKRGFIGSMANAFYAFMKEAKLYELELKSTVKNNEMTVAETKMEVRS